jgi:hypothetical protein
MLTYSDLQNLLDDNKKQFDKLKQQLFTEIQSLRDTLTEYLELPSQNFEQLVSIKNGQREVVIRDRVALYKQEIEVSDDGSASFRIILNFKDCNPIGFPLNIRFVDNKPVYRLDHSLTFLPKEAMAEAIIEELARSLSFNPFSGEEKPPESFNMG